MIISAVRYPTLFVSITAAYDLDEGEDVDYSKSIPSLRLINMNATLPGVNYHPTGPSRLFWQTDRPCVSKQPPVVKSLLSVGGKTALTGIVGVHAYHPRRNGSQFMLRSIGQWNDAFDPEVIDLLRRYVHPNDIIPLTRRRFKRQLPGQSI